MLYRSSFSFSQCSQAAEDCVYRSRGPLPEKSCQSEQAPLLWLRQSASYSKEQSPFSCIFASHNQCKCLTRNVNGKVDIECSVGLLASMYAVACSLQGSRFERVAPVGCQPFKRICWLPLSESLRVRACTCRSWRRLRESKRPMPDDRMQYLKRVFYLTH